MELEREAKSTNPKLPKLKITPFKGTVVDWIRLENIFLTQIDKRPNSDEEKFGYLLELVNPKVRADWQILNQVLRDIKQHGKGSRQSRDKPNRL